MIIQHTICFNPPAPVFCIRHILDVSSAQMSILFGSHPNRADTQLVAWWPGIKSLPHPWSACPQVSSFHCTGDIHSTAASASAWVGKTSLAKAQLNIEILYQISCKGEKRNLFFFSPYLYRDTTTEQYFTVEILMEIWRPLETITTYN